MLRAAASFTFDHDPALVALAAAICLLACLSYVSMLARAAAVQGPGRIAWGAVAAVAFGSGVWATDFIALIAYHTTLQPEYALPQTAGALCIAITGCALASAARMHQTRRGGRPRGRRILAGLLLGSTIAAMHFTGMLALRRVGVAVYDIRLVVAAIALGAILATAAMLVKRRHHAAAVCLLGAAILGLHFTAMAAIHLVPWVPGDSAGELVASGSLALAIGAVVLVILLLSLAGTMIDAHLAHRAVEDSRRLRQFSEATFEGILFCRNGLITDSNAALRRLGGWDDKTLIGWPLERLFVPEAAVLLGPVGAGARTDAIETALLAHDGTTRPVELLCRPIAKNGETGAVVAVRDISERKAAEQRIGELAHYDLLTGCANRALFRDRLAQALAMAERSGHGVALLYCNVDRFKEVNDLRGHAVGDRLLVALANRMRTRLRDTDTLARLGGDEFAIIQPRIDGPDDAGMLTQRLLNSLAEPFEIDPQSIQVSMTAGVALYPQDGATGETLLRAADIALHRAKQVARGGFHFYAAGMDSELVHRLTLEHDLARAIPRGELLLHYQPVFEVLGRRLIGHEALLRWQHPERGAISPALFVPLAERNRQIVPIGQWVLRTACAAAAATPGDSRIAVNLSPVQMRLDDLPRLVAKALHDTGLEPQRLELEITEGVLIEESAHTLAVLLALKRLGVRIVLDDFGTGYSSLSYLRRFPFDKLKIDQSFMKGLGEDGESDAIVRAILALGHSLRLEVTAEGVETETQLRMLRHYGCDQAQGFLLGRPGPGLGAVEARKTPVAAAA
jgi:diguanylate cyclase (GGDEF)-like protein/PAS domain S-box-containing protein